MAAAVITGWYQSRATRDQIKSAHESQIKLLEATQTRDDELRTRQYAESDRADRLLITEYVDLLLPRLIDITSIYFLRGDEANKDEVERQTFLRFQRFMKSDTLDPAHPEKNLKLRLSFLLFQLIGAMRLALNSRWTRPLTPEQSRFLEHWEAHLEPVLCSGRYPGDEFLYREQIEIIADEMIPSTDSVYARRPINWHDFHACCGNGGVLKTLAELVGKKLAFIFEDSNPKTTPLRRAAQCRLAILALYLIQMSEDAGNPGWTKRAPGIWKTVTSWFEWQQSHGQDPQWFVFTYGDVAARLKAEQRLESERLDAVEAKRLAIGTSSAALSANYST